MTKKILISVLFVVLLGAVLVGTYDAVRGASTLPTDLQQLTFENPVAQPAGSSQPGQGRGPGNEAGVPQPHNWVTLSGVVVSSDPQQLVVDTTERGRLVLWLGKSGFADTQEISFTPGDAVTILGFEGENGTFQAGQITNEATGAVLHLRDPNGRPLWAGQGQGQSGGQGQGNNRGQGNGQGRGGGQRGGYGQGQ